MNPLAATANQNDKAEKNVAFPTIWKIVGKTPRIQTPQSPQPPRPSPDPDGNQPTRPSRPPRPAVSALNVAVTFPPKYLSNLWRFLDLPLINCEIELGLSWPKNCELTEHHNDITGVNVMVTSTKLYVPVVMLSIHDNMKFLENIKQGFKITISWNKYTSEIALQTKINDLHYLIDPTFSNINRLFVLLFKNGDDDPTQDSFDKYYMPLVEIKYFKVLIDNNHFWLPCKKLTRSV